MTRFAFIDVQRATYGVSVLCRVLGVSRSGFYAWAGRPPSSHEVSDAVLTEQIRTAFTSNRSVYGAPRVHAELAADGVRAGRKRVARLMRGAGLVGCHRRKRSFSVTRQDPAAAAAPDLVERSFTATAPNQLWVADVTYVPTVVGWLYLACVTDVFSRMIVGWSMASHRKTELVVDAVTTAVGRRGGHVPGVIHHSDRGAEYTSHALERELRRHRVLPSMGSVADCYDNALAESVFATLECELFDQQPGGRVDSHHAARLAIFDFIEGFYNPRRRHSALPDAVPGRLRTRPRLRPGRDCSGSGVTTPASRDDRVTTRPACPACGQPLTQPRGRQAYCSPACRQRAYRHRHRQPLPLPAPSRQAGALIGYQVVYQCPDCDSLYLGQQRCPDCNTFCTRLGPGGDYPHCQEVITLHELLHP